MKIKSPFLCLLFSLFFFVGPIIQCDGQAIKINPDHETKTVVFGNSDITLTLNYDQKAVISVIVIKGDTVLGNSEGVYAAIKTKTAAYSTLRLSENPLLSLSKNRIRLSNIRYGDSIEENWTFTITETDIKFDIDRTLSQPMEAEQVAFPVFTFKHINTWEGAYQDYGGLAWFYLFNKKLDTYGVHSQSSRFFNSQTGHGLTISMEAGDKAVAMDYSRTDKDEMAWTIALSEKEISPRFDSLTYRRRFIRDRTDVWAPVKLNAGKTSQSIALSYFDVKEKFDRGNLAGINEEQVSAVLNTIARIGVIDKNHFGGNSWHTPYGPICLHEQYIAQLGLAINDSTYLKGYQQTLDFYRDNAIKPDGRVWSRWAYSNEDAMPQAFTDKGFYEAQWGYLMDSNPDFVTNIAELYDQTGDKAWVKTHQLTAEKALDWIIKRDSDNDGLVEMMTDSHKQKRGSDWIDIIWAAYENAFVNAKLYHALVLWADIEKQLGNPQKASYYSAFAEKLKTSFNKPTTEGGFWDAEKKCYVHWLDKDGSVHGNNMVIPVNFMAIAYGICHDAERTKTILDAVEVQMQKENLFFWPLCLYSYAPGEGNDWQFPFPNYENGDIFLSWGAVGVKAYAAYRPELALKYVRKVLEQYSKDGLAFQRYGRTKQEGLGDDILSGNSLAVVGLYQSVYGINPRYNRLYLDPHITGELDGTRVNYHFRGQLLKIDLAVGKYKVSNEKFSVADARDFGFFSEGNALSYFHGNSSKASLSVSSEARLSLDIHKWNPDQLSWTQGSEGMGNLNYQVHDLKPGRFYTVMINNKLHKRLKTNAAGMLTFGCKVGKNQDTVTVLNK